MLVFAPLIVMIALLALFILFGIIIRLHEE
nr:MAG TPA: hypothetical protein [Caudoviricetes sp.]